jgi:hypothetical protein
MILNLAFAFWSSDFLRFFTENRDYDDWQSVSFSWVLSAIVISVICAGMMLIIKWVRKRRAGVIKNQAWSRNETIVFLAIGLAPVLVLGIVIWYFSRDIENVTGLTGLVKGVVLSWLLYVLLMLVGHLGPWRRDIY